MTQEERVIELLRNSPEYFLQVNGEANWRDGWKVSIQGHTLENTKYLITRLVVLFEATKASYKFATQRLIDLKTEQSTKLVTVYVPNGVEIRSFCELIRLNIPDYEGAYSIEEKRSYTKYSDGIFYRNDRDKEGNYIYA